MLSTANTGATAELPSAQVIALLSRHIILAGKNI